MFLKRIEILGFKSFADRTVIEFTDGITALLGPNGCGKSNIVDAIKWVLGEQSVRNMRAERMEDVIFSGTEQRKALSVAEVTLTIANENGILDIERPEIAIKRRIFREGDSEYFLNGTPVRLKEIRELFFDTGVGKSAYSVMEQGRIDQLLSSRPEERRYIFEEAAGITRYRMRGSEAGRKLVKTEENIAQVDNILNEVRRSYNTLKKQTDKTLEYRRLREKVFELDRDLKLIQYNKLKQNKSKKQDSLAGCEQKLQKAVSSIDEMRETLATEVESVSQMESRLIESQKRLYGMDLEKENLEQQVRSVRELRHEAAEALQAIQVREQNARDSLDGLNKLKNQRQADIAAFKDRLKETEGNILTIQKSISAAEERLNRNANETEDVNSQLNAEEQRRESLQEDLKTLTDDIVRELDRGLKESGYDRNTRRALESSILKLLDEAGIRAQGRAGLLTDQTNLTDGETALKLLSAAAGDFAGLAQTVKDIAERFSEYRDSEAGFLEEFLAPEGIITRKRNLDEKIDASALRAGDFKTSLEKLNVEKISLEQSLNESRERLEELRVAQARTTTQAAAAADSLASLERETEAGTQRLDEIRQQRAAEEKRIRGLDDQIKISLEKGEKLDKEQAGLRKDMAVLESGISSENKKMTGREKKLAVLTEKRGRLEIEREKISLEMTHTDNEIRLLLEDFRDRNSRELTDFSELEIKDSPRNIRERLGQARGALKGLGQVNLMAPEEFREVSERFEFLNRQLDDLRKAKDDLSQVTDKILSESSELFMNTYKEIRGHFRDMFRSLFGGGRTEIRLTDPDHPLDSGVEIYAQPPGKKLENISLLSGGEKSLCGVALMFATFQVRPSPFCILDEIDAALDDANIQRFVNLLTGFGGKSQFVVITHNKKTVSGAKTLLGVTMQESGISRLITMRLDGREHEKSSSAD